jgi:flavin prenyltransferase
LRYTTGIKMKDRIIVGISGASGAAMAVELLLQLRKQESVETHFIYTKAAELTLKQETKFTLEEMCAMADVVYDNENIGAALASGSFKTKGMIILPCSMKTVAGIACGYSDNLLLRAADVILKERRKLVMGVRECPFSTLHLENMQKLSSMGAVIMPLVLSFYNHPDSLEACIKHIIGKILDQFDMEGEAFSRWEGA